MGGRCGGRSSVAGRSQARPTTKIGWSGWGVVRYKGRAGLALTMFESNRKHPPKTSTSDVWQPLHHLERPSRRQSQSLEKTNWWWWRSRRRMASEHDKSLKARDREGEQVRQLLAWYQSRGQCWTLVGHQGRMTSPSRLRKGKRREGKATQKRCLSAVLGEVVGGRARRRSGCQGRRYIIINRDRRRNSWGRGDQVQDEMIGRV